jgi:hypothetical protein
MKQIPEHLYGKLKTLTEEVKQDLRRRGIAIPTMNNDGTIALGQYTIVKQNSFYAIIDYAGDVVVDKINLPQSAAILANSLALGKFVDEAVLTADRNYGYEEFEELLHNKIAKQNMSKNVDRADVMLTKSKINRVRKEKYKQDIVRSFEKLRKFA